MVSSCTQIHVEPDARLETIESFSNHAWAGNLLCSAASELHPRFDLIQSWPCAHQALRCAVKLVSISASRCGSFGSMQSLLARAVLGGLTMVNNSLATESAPDTMRRWLGGLLHRTAHTLSPQELHAGHALLDGTRAHQREGLRPARRCVPVPWCLGEQAGE